MERCRNFCCVVQYFECCEVFGLYLTLHPRFALNDEFEVREEYSLFWIDFEKGVAIIISMQPGHVCFLNFYRHWHVMVPCFQGLDKSLQLPCFLSCGVFEVSRPLVSQIFTLVLAAVNGGWFATSVSWEKSMWSVGSANSWGHHYHLLAFVKSRAEVIILIYININ